jgi:probable rRNA maturation factor
VVFVSARKIRALNRQFRGRDYATDILSFSYGDANQAMASGGAPGSTNGQESGFRWVLGNSPSGQDGSAMHRHLGDIVISPEVACAQAMRYRLLPERQLRVLLVHGILHLLGYDHESDDGEMRRLQARLVRRRSFAQAAPVADIRQ